MNLTKTLHKAFVILLVITSTLKTLGQDSASKIAIDTSFGSQDSLKSIRFQSSFIRYQPSFNYNQHSPNKKDRKFYKKYQTLINAKPNAENYQNYYTLACSLWELNKTVEAEKMFLSIIRSKEKFYTSNYYHSSDIPSDKTKNIYGYGSYTSNYKNGAAIYLAQVYIEQKKFDKAFQFVELAVKKYKATYTCGTGYHWQKEKYDFLYASCYAGQNKSEQLLKLLLPKCLWQTDDLIIDCIKKKYSQNEIKDYLMKAESSIRCSLDTFPSIAFMSIYGESKEEKKRHHSILFWLCTIKSIQSYN
jgi:hypothetical protein